MALVGAQFVNAVSPNPVGSLQAYAGASAPTGWLLCNGSQQPIATYPELYSVLSTTYGALTNGSGGAGSTHFRVPDLRGRVPMGAGTGTGLNASGTGAPSGSAQTARARGDWGGEETHLLTSGESGVPAHNHPPGTGGTAFLVTNGTATTPNTGSAIASASGTPSTTGNNSAANAASRHATIPPFIVTNYIIKAYPDVPRGGTALGTTPPIVTAFPSNPQFGEQVTFYGSGQYEPYQYMGADGWKQLGTSCAPSVGLWLTSSVSQTANTSISWNTTPLWDTDTMFASANPTRMTAKTAGVYLVTASGQTTASSAYSYLLITLKVNGSLKNSASYYPINANEVRFNFSVAYNFAANDYAEIQVGYSATGFSLSGTTDNETRTRATMTYLSAGAL